MRKIKVTSLERRMQIGVEKRARTRASILDATFQVIGHEHGRLARIEQVTEIAKIARPTFYTYFSSMEELLAALSYELSHEFNSAVLNYCALLNDPAAEGGAAIRYYLRKAIHDPKWGWGMVNISLGGPIFGDETNGAALATIRQGMKSGAFKVPDVNIGRDMLLGTTLAAMMTLLRGVGGDDYPEVVAKHILVGLGVPSRQAERITKKILPDPILTVNGASSDEVTRGSQAAGLQ